MDSICDKIVIKGNELTNEINDILKSEWYDQDSLGLVSSGNNLYELMKNKYVGITRKVCNDFVKNQRRWQLKRRSTQHLILNPIVRQYPNELWCFDLIDFQKYSGANYGISYLLVVIDHFSKFGWVRPLASRLQNNIIDQLKQIIKVETTPVFMLSDNEFRNNIFNNFYKEHQIIGFTSKAYTPEQNGCAERFVGTIKRKLYLCMGEKNRYIDFIENVCYNYNNEIHSTHGQRPVDVYRFMNENEYKNIEKKIELKGKKMLNTYKMEFEIGDKVRLSVKTKSGSVWTEDIYTISAKKKRVYQLENRYLDQNLSFWQEDVGVKIVFYSNESNAFSNVKKIIVYGKLKEHVKSFKESFNILDTQIEYRELNENDEDFFFSINDNEKVKITNNEKDKFYYKSFLLDKKWYKNYRLNKINVEDNKDITINKREGMNNYKRSDFENLDPNQWYKKYDALKRFLQNTDYDHDFRSIVRNNLVTEMSTDKTWYSFSRAQLTEIKTLQILKEGDIVPVYNLRNNEEKYKSSTLYKNLTKENNGYLWYRYATSDGYKKFDKEYNQYDIPEVKKQLKELVLKKIAEYRNNNKKTKETSNYEDFFKHVEDLK
jgi:transposase InsO family protein